MAYQQNVKITSTTNSVKIATPPATSGRSAKSDVNVFVTPDFIHEPFEGFVGFLREYAVVGLAVGFAVGTQAQQVVKQILATVIDPLFKLLFGEALSTRTFTLYFHTHAANFGWGALLYSLLNFLFVLAAIYVIIKLFKLDKLKKDKGPKDSQEKTKKKRP